ncbi:MAG: hypothetical protein GC186_16545 [Rhodobacteraceae bacterium]|nr:hypothetical protein [Paracoccaceae bacterium]
MKIANIALISVACAAILSGCSTQTAPVPDPNYVSPATYDGYNCRQIKAEQALVGSKIAQASQSGAQNQILNTALQAFAISNGYGWQQDQSDNGLTRLRNEQDVLDETAIKHQCIS